MPDMAPRECTHPTCHVLLPGGVDRYRCTKHDTQRSRRPGSKMRGYDAAWRKLRLKILRERPICQQTGCGRASGVVDHVVSRSRGGTDDESNLQALCVGCHSALTVKYDGGFGNPLREGK